MVLNGRGLRHVLQSKYMPSARRVQWAKFRVTVVAVAAIAILGVLVYLLSGGSWLQPKTYLITYIPDSTGLDPDDDVQLNGVLIGSVESLRLSGSKDPNRMVEVRLKIRESDLRYIPEDSVTAMESENVLGDQYVRITIGTSPRHVRPGGELRYRSPTAIMQNIDLVQFQTQLNVIDKIIRETQEGKGPLGQFYASDQLYTSTLAGISKIEQKLHAATGTESQLGQYLYSAQTYNDIRKSIHELDGRLAQLQANPLMRSSAQYDQVRGQLEKLHATLADLNAGKGAGGEMLTSDAAYREWNRRLAGWIQSIDEIGYGEGPLDLGNAQTYESLNGSLRDLEKTVKEFREDPQKFLRIKMF